MLAKNKNLCKFTKIMCKINMANTGGECGLLIALKCDGNICGIKIIAVNLMVLIKSVS